MITLSVHKQEAEFVERDICDRLSSYFICLEHIKKERVCYLNRFVFEELLSLPPLFEGHEGGQHYLQAKERFYS